MSDRRPFIVGSSLTPSPPPPRTKELKRGRTKKAKANMRANKTLKAVAIRDGRETCEVRGPQCTGGYFLTWAHGRKRRKLKPGELEEFAILCCRNCHRHLDEDLTHAGMARRVRQIINARGRQ